MSTWFVTYWYWLVLPASRAETRPRDCIIVDWAPGNVVLLRVYRESLGTVLREPWLYGFCLSCRAKQLVPVYMLQAGMLYDTALFFFSEKAGLSNFRGVTQNGCHSCHSVCKKWISGFHISWVDLNNCLKKRKMLWERFVPSRAEHWADPLTWKALFITLPAFPKQLSACPCMLSMFSHPSSLYTSPCRSAEKTGKEKVFRFSLQGLSGVFLCTIMKFCGSDRIHAFAVFLAF